MPSDNAGSNTEVVGRRVFKKFYNMRQNAHESTDTFSLRLYREYKQVVKVQRNDGDIPMSEKTLISQLITAVREKSMK